MTDLTSLERYKQALAELRKPVKGDAGEKIAAVLEQMPGVNMRGVRNMLKVTGSFEIIEEYERLFTGFLFKQGD